MAGKGICLPMRNVRSLSWKILGAFFCVLASIVCYAGSAKEFQDGDVVCFLGDSITHGGRYHSYIWEYYVSRYPDRKMTFYNCGISGDTAYGSLIRLDWDLLNRKPKKTTIMLGMNDVGRSLYGKENPDEKNLKDRKARIERHKESMKKITDELKKNNIEIIYITPSPYDQTSKIEKENLFGVNDALAECGEFCREQAKENKAGLVDFNKPMTELNIENQKSDPKFTLIGRDRVHPGATGHFVMAYLFLKSQGVSGIVSSAKLDYKAGKVISENNCKISNLKKDNKSLKFDCLEKSLPMATSREYKEADKFVALTEDLNNETLAVEGLPDGEFELLIDGKKVQKADAKAWAKGINLATLPTPMQAQAAKVHNLIMQKSGAERTIRSLVKLEIIMRRKKVDLGNLDAREKFFEKFLEDVKGKPYEKYYKNVIKSYKVNKPKENELLDKIKKLNLEIYKEAKPKPHHYEIKAL
jgi:endoglucanase